MNYLNIRDRGKAIPYPPSDRADGSRNHGFRPVKGDARAAAEIPEAQNDSHLLVLLVAANDPATGVFTVGCESGPWPEAERFRRSGYVEFALNDRTVVADAETYFRVFFLFDRLWKSYAVGLQAILNWELHPASFLDAGIDGLTCAVFVNTDLFPSQAEADRCWGTCLDLLARLLGHIPAASGAARIY